MSTFTDIPADHLTLRAVPASWRPYVLLMRLDRPIGTWLLLFPCWWSLVLGSDHLTFGVLAFAMLCAIGAVVMRGAGCTINDMADRDFDAQVERTKHRPIASGQISRQHAAVFLAAQLLVGLVILLQFPPFAIAVGAASLLLVFPYPLMKRITYWPQAWLGLTFNWGALVGWAAVHNDLHWPAFALYAAGIFWTLGYDTIYAHQDKEDDMLVGVKSTALALGALTRHWLWLFYGMTVAGMAIAGMGAGLAWPFYPMLAAAAGQLVWQIVRVDIDDPASCLFIFRANRWFGWLALTAFMAGRLF